MSRERNPVWEVSGTRGRQWTYSNLFKKAGTFEAERAFGACSWGAGWGPYLMQARPTGGVLCMLICIVIHRDWMFVRTKDLNCGETEFVDLKCVCEYIVIPREYFPPEIEPEV